MNTRHLEEFVLFAEDPNYTTAAERLYITRPTLVEHIRMLEEELACKLVASDQRQVALTAAGRRFAQTARDLLASWEGVRTEYRTLSDNLLTVTVSSSNLPWLETILYKARRAIARHHPYKRVEIIADAGTHAAIEALAESANDIVVAGYKSYLCGSEVPPLPEELRGFLLCTEEIKLLMTPENPLFTMTAIHVRDLDGATFILPPDIYRSWARDRVAERLAKHGARVELREVRFSDHAEYFTYDFGQALGIVPTTLMPRYGIGAREEYRAFSLADLTLETNFYAVFRREFTQTENGGLLFEEMRRAAQG